MAEQRADRELDIVTGAFGYTGKYITRALLKSDRRVRTLTGKPLDQNPFGELVEAVPYNFDHPGALVKSLQGAHTVYNTYWVRFPHDETTYDNAVGNTRMLIEAAVQAGIKRFVHISIANPDKTSAFPYFQGKAAVEKALIDSRLSYVVLRPTVLFGEEGILVNNIAWMLRRFPFFLVPGNGHYKIQPVYVNDLAELAVAFADRRENIILDAVGPETFTYVDFIELIRQTVGSHAPLIHVAPTMVQGMGKLLGRFMHDVVITQEEILGLMAGLLVSHRPPTCPTQFTRWIKRNRDSLGKHYQNELTRHYK